MCVWWIETVLRVKRYTPDEIDPTRIDEEDGEGSEEEEWEQVGEDGESEAVGVDYVILSTTLR